MYTKYSTLTKEEEHYGKKEACELDCTGTGTDCVWLCI